MRNNFKSLLFIILSFFLLIKSLSANEPFIFDITEIEILEDGNQINGFEGGTATTEDGSTITAENFYYNKITNILETTGDVKYFDKIKNIIITADKAIYLKNEEKVFTTGNSKVVNENNTITAASLEYDKINNIFKAKKDAIVNDLKKDTTIYADKITYLKNKEKVFTEGKTEALIEKKYKFNSENVSYFRNIGDLFSQNKSSIEDDNGNIYKLDSFSYNINQEILKGKKIEVLAKVDENKIDQYFFSEGFFNFADKSHIAKKTKIKTHKDVFGDKKQDPRIYGSSSFSDEKKTVISNAIFTSCKLNDNCPPWSIKAEKITHDKINQDMIYKNAILKIYDVPVLYFPKFFHPDPSVKRRNGFLQPQFNNSETLGSSLYIPYFKTLGHDKDLTFKATLFEKLKKFKKEKYILQSEFRKQNKDSYLIADLGILRDYKASNDNKIKNANHLFLDFTANLKLQNYSESGFEAQIEKVNNDTYLQVFQNILTQSPVMPNSLTSMNSNLKFYLNNDDQNFSTGVQVYENLGIKKNSDKYQYTLPYYDFNKDLTSIIEENSFSGALNFSSSGNNTLKNTNNLRSIITNNIVYNSPDYITNLGFLNNFGLYFKNLNSIGKNDTTYTSNAQIDGMSIVKIDTIYPLTKSNNIVAETLTPKFSLMINPGNNMNDYSGSSSTISADNAFDINRLGLSNDFEAGRSLTIGLDYKFDKLEEDSNKDIDDEEIKDKYLEFKIATVVRDQIETEIPSSSTINRKNSNLFGSIENRLLENANISYNFSIDNDMKTINSHNFGTEFSINNFVTTFNYIEDRNELGSTHLISNETEYKVDDNRSLKFSTRRNKKINLTEYYNLSYEYKNDCLTAAIKFNKTFYQNKDLVPTEDLFFTITLIPLTTYEREIYKKTPGASGLGGWFR
ncbi:organic solvent tolerance protein [Candidatus Pelagibacter sp.]|nr:organic solvent tolerance protein [Candidatus Pelagibacter sp.]